MQESEQLSRRYQRIFLQIQDLINTTNDTVARMATIAAVLHNKIPHFFWTGFYLLKEEKLLVGPYQGPVACQVLEGKKGVCWAGILEEKTIIVPDVHAFPGHIACDSRSNSEIVVPLRKHDGTLWGVLDVDSRKLEAFSEIDQEWLEKIVNLI